jgi:hypothetical protein
VSYAFLADVLVVIHTAFCGFVLFGQVLITLVWLSRLFQAAASVDEAPGYRLPVFGWVSRWGWVRNPWFRTIHLLCILTVAVEAYYQYQCPLTTWEEELRVMAGQKDVFEEGSFTGRLLNEILFSRDYDPDLIHKIHMAFGAFVFFTFLCFPPRFRPKKAPAAVGHPPAALASGTAGPTRNGHAAAATDPAIREPAPVEAAR